MWLVVAPAFDAEESALMTLPKALKDTFIIAPSLRRSPTALVALCLSLPARSIRWNLLLIFE
jgi:hypothetical protein